MVYVMPSIQRLEEVRVNKMEKEKILQVKNLRISFKTNTGTVKAVRGIDFDLYRGRTLAIVGESGSGKSVTSKAILGILANNKIVEDGEIIYDGKDLLSLPEHKFTKIRGVKISMIFQDPLSALNPIMKVGKQLTEAMYLEAKSLKKESTKYLDGISSALAKYVSKEDAKLLKNLDSTDVEEITRSLKGIHNSFKHLIEKVDDEYVNNLNETLKVANEYKDKVFKDSFSPKVALKELNKVKKAIKKSNNILYSEPDDILDVYVSLMKSKIKGYNQSIKLRLKLDELLAKEGAKDVFELKASLRTKQREVINPKQSYVDAMEHMTNRLISHIQSLIKQFSSLSDDMVTDLIDTCAKMVAKRSKKLSKQETKERAISLMSEVGIPNPEKRYYQYPFEFSGGMRQRIVIAIALSGNPEVLICDEPTTALDVTIQAQILELINRLKEEKNLSIIFITHDLGVVANMADDIAVMYAGKIVEFGTVYDIFYDPRHPYTWALLGSMPDLDTKGKLDAIPGTPPNMLLPPKGDAFAARNSYALALDYKQEPPFFDVSETHKVKSWLAHKDAPNVKAPKTVVDRIRKSLEKNPANKPTYDLAKNSILESLGGKK